MIFVTLGTDHHPFSRLVSWLSAAIDSGIVTEQIVIQHGFTPVPDARMEKHEIIGFDEMVRYFDEASAVVTHASSTAMLVCHRRRRPIVVPRDPALGEHVDNHQAEFIDATRAIYPFFVARSQDDLFDGLRRRATISQWNDEFEVGGLEAIRRFKSEFDDLLREV